VTAHVVAADLSDPAQVRRVLDEVDRLGVHVACLINNAGFGARGPFVRIDSGRQLDMLQVDVAAPLALTHALLPAMVRAGRGRILNVGSMAGFVPGPYMATYHASKAFLQSFSEALVGELRGTGVTVTLSAPGVTATGFQAVAGTSKGPLRDRRAASAADVAREAYTAMLAGRPLVVHGRGNRIYVQLMRLAPRAAVRLGVVMAHRLERPGTAR